MTLNNNLFVVAYKSGRIVFHIHAKTPDGNDGIGKIYYYFLNDGKFEEVKTNFGVGGMTMKSGTCLSLQVLRDAWTELEEGQWVRVRAEEQFFSETIK